MDLLFPSQTFADVLAISPEMIVVVTMLLVLFYDLFLTREQSHRSGWIAALGIFCATCLAILQWIQPPLLDTAFSGLIANDRYTQFARLLFYPATLVVVLMSLATKELERLRSGEYYALLLAATSAAVFMVGSTNLLMLYLSIETLSLPCYVLAGYRKGDRQAAEASLKYVLFGALASGILVYGLSLLYGMSGSLQYETLLHTHSANHTALMLTLILVAVGFAFKISAVPFHFWAPDVYQGSPTPVTAYLSVVSKAAGFAALMRLLAPYFDVTTIVPYITGSVIPAAIRFDLQSVFWILAVMTMAVGNLVALRQTDIKRLLAYSSIAHAGYMLTAFVAANQSGFQAILFYLFVYFIANLGVFLVAVLVYRQVGSYNIADYRGLLYRAPTLAVGMSILLWSLIGLPPSAGFVGKWKLFAAIVARGQVSPNPYFYYSLVLIALLMSVVSLYYYIAIIRVMCFYTPTDERPFRMRALSNAAVLLFAIPILLLQLNWQPVTRLVLRSMTVSWEQMNATSATPDQNGSNAR